METDSFVNERILEAYGWTAESLEAPVPNNSYGEKWPEGTHQWFYEAYRFNKCSRNDPMRFFHMVNMIKLDLPEFVFTAKGYINTECLRLLKALCENADVGIAGAASSGKTYPVAAFRLESWKSRPHQSLDFVCTTSIGAAEQRIWGAIVSLYQNSKIPVGKYIPHKHAIVWGNFSENADQRDFTSAIIALAIEKGNEGRKAIDTTRGRKQTNVSITFDELPEMENYVTLALVNLEANDNLEACYIGNPNKKTDAHGNALKPDHPLGFDSITKETRQWKTRTGIALFLNGELSANYQCPIGESAPFKGIISREKIQRMLARCHGNKNSLDYWRNAIGFWPGSSVGRTVLTKELILISKADQTTRWRDLNRVKLCGFDAGFVAGGDKCIGQYGELGTNEFGRKILRWLLEVEYTPEVGRVFEESIAEQLVKDLILYGVSPGCFGMDISGDGGKILRAIIREWIKVNPHAADIVPISSMGKPTDRIFSSVDPRPCNEVFDRMVSEYWMVIQEGVSCQVLNGLPLYQEGTSEPNEMIDQLCTREYSIKGKKFCLETKDEMKERTQGKSPDSADGYAYLVEIARRHGLIFTAPIEVEKRQERKIFSRQFKRKYEYATDSWGED